MRGIFFLLISPVKRNQALLSDPKGKYVTETMLTVEEHEKLDSHLKSEEKVYLRHQARESTLDNDELVRIFPFDENLSYNSLLYIFLR